MSGLRSALQGDEFRAAVSRINLGPPVQLQRVVSKIDRGQASDTRPVELAEIQRRLLQAITNGNLPDVLRRDLREGARSYLSGAQPIGRQTAARPEFLSEVNRRPLRSAILAH